MTVTKLIAGAAVIARLVSLDEPVARVPGGVVAEAEPAALIVQRAPERAAHGTQRSEVCTLGHIAQRTAALLTARIFKVQPLAADGAFKKFHSSNTGSGGYGGSGRSVVNGPGPLPRHALFNENAGYGNSPHANTRS